MDYDKWVSLGERLGLKDGELRDYVQKKESEYLDREERNIRREEDKRRFEAERLEKEAEREEGRRRFEAERLEKEAEHGFRNKFRESKPEQGETVNQFMARLDRYFSRWTEMADAADTVDKLKDLIIREQFVKVCSTELALFLKERKPKDRRDVISLAEQYLEAHGGTITNSKSSKVANFSNKSPIRLNQGNLSKPIQHFHRENRKVTCFICNREGHVARDCRDQTKKRYGAAAMSYGEQNRNYFKTNRDSSPRNWRSRPGENRRDGRSDDKKVSGLCMSISPTSSYDGCIEEGKLKLANGNSVPVITSSCTIESLEGERQLDLN
ncbi:uncharacterized protein LOC132732326 [Ruditapes philippinarum]|uniref:uncharacterized protein LOC132732326 n=1 Tax=Ruditapes philippinarum TaxID=129788 RepID=UPI00295B0045|nr:uncharacterized protein LOC132732326 [Ruditapes philippinarum]